MFQRPNQKSLPGPCLQQTVSDECPMVSDVYLTYRKYRPLLTSISQFMIGNSLKLECEKLAGEKMEIQRHYVMVKKKKKNTKTCVCIDA